METTHTFTVSEPDVSKRLDVFLAERLPEDISRSGIKNLIKKGLVLAGGSTVKAGHRLRSGEEVRINIPEPTPSGVVPELIPLDIIHEDDDVIVINKPPDLTVHPGAGRSAGTLVNALLHHTKNLSSIGGPLRPGIVHRLDKDTSGSLVVAKTDRAHLSLAKQFEEHTTTRRYHALVWGAVEDDESTAEGIIDLAIGRDIANRKKISTKSRKKRAAVTRYRVVRRFEGFTLLEVSPETGRTHQIRVHLQAIKHPIVGDPLYGRKTLPPNLDKPLHDALKGTKTQCLHASVIGFNHPTGPGGPGGNAYVEFSAPMPPVMKKLLKLLEERAVA
ncbi:MAG: RluA family pseudouridine synthase [Thermodesulfobacteriota bacterium]